jgi:hypothetical protein
MPKKPTNAPDTKDKSIADAAAGKTPSRAGTTPETPPHAKTMKKGKLPKKDKHRLPRRQKKAQQKGQASHHG